MFLYSAISSLLDRSKRFTRFAVPGRPVHSDTNLASPGNMLAMLQLRARTKSLTFPPLSITRYSFIQLSQLERQWRERKCPIFEMAAKGIRTRAHLIAELPRSTQQYVIVHKSGNKMKRTNKRNSVLLETTLLLRITTIDRVYPNLILCTANGGQPTVKCHRFLLVHSAVVSVMHAKCSCVHASMLSCQSSISRHRPSLPLVSPVPCVHNRAAETVYLTVASSYCSSSSLACPSSWVAGTAGDRSPPCCPLCCVVLFHPPQSYFSNTHFFT